MIQYLLPHYILFIILSYVYKPRLARMIHSYTQEKLDIIQIKNSFNLIKFFNQCNVPGSNGYRYSYLNYQAF